MSPHKHFSAWLVLTCLAGLGTAMGSHLAALAGEQENVVHRRSAAAQASVPLQPGQTVRFNRDGVTKFSDTSVVRPQAGNPVRLAADRGDEAPPDVPANPLPPAWAPPSNNGWCTPWYTYSYGYGAYPPFAGMNPRWQYGGSYYGGFDNGRRETLFKGALDMYNERVGNAPATTADPNDPRCYGGVDPSYDSGYRSGQHLAELWLARDRNVVKTARLAIQNGAALFREGKYQEAVDAFRLAASSNHGDPGSRLLAGHAYFALGRYHSAMSFVRRAFELQPKIARLDFDIRNDYGDPAAFAKHLDVLKKAAAERPQDIQIWTLLGYVQRYSGNRTESINALKRAYKIDPADEIVRSLLDLAPDPTK